MAIKKWMRLTQISDCQFFVKSVIINSAIRETVFRKPFNLLKYVRYFKNNVKFSIF